MNQRIKTNQWDQILVAEHMPYVTLCSALHSYIHIVVGWLVNKASDVAFNNELKNLKSLDQRKTQWFADTNRNTANQRKIELESSCNQFHV